MIAKLASKLTPGELPRPVDGVRNAAVAVLIHEAVGGDPRVLLMKRAERTGDPWSGHISLPGGGHSRDDASLLVTAIRETHEELGIDLDGARLLGPLPPVTPRTGSMGIQIQPFAFATEVAVEPVCGPEALAAFWLPLATAATGSLDGTYTYPGSQMTFPSWSYEGHVIWGLTWRILGDVIELARG